MSTAMTSEKAQRNVQSLDSAPKKAKVKFLRKIPQIPHRRPVKGAEESEETEDGEEEEEEEEEGKKSEKVHCDYHTPAIRDSRNAKPPLILAASSLGLNHIRTRTSPAPSPLKFSSSSVSHMDQTMHDHKEKAKAGVDNRSSYFNPSQHAASADQGRKVSWAQSKSLRVPTTLNAGMESFHAGLAKELQSPRFQAVLRVTSGRKKKTHDIKSFSHELNSKGVHPFPVWKSRGLGHMEEIMVAIRAKFDRLKEEVNADLGIFAGDLVSMLEKNSESLQRCKEGLEDLLVVARLCAKMSSSEFWVKCEGIVQNLDDKRQELPMGALKKAHTRLLFILTRCTRLVQFQKESGYAEDHVLHQLSDLGVYPEQVLENARQDASVEKENEKQNTDLNVPDRQELSCKQDPSDWHSSGAFDATEVSTARSTDSASSSFRMSSWKKLPSAAEKNRKSQNNVNQSKDKEESKTVEETGCETSIENPESPSHHLSSCRNISWTFWADHQSVTYDDSMICRICEVEIPVVHVELHSRICTIADRCDLKGLSVNERLERVADSLEKIMESLTPKENGTPVKIFENGGVSTSTVHDDPEDMSSNQNSPACRCYVDGSDTVTGSDNTCAMEYNNGYNEVSSDTNFVQTLLEYGAKSSSAGSLTPRSPPMTPRMSQIESLQSGQRMLTEFDSNQQIRKLYDITRAVVKVNDHDYSALEYMLYRLEELKYAIQDRKADALVVETFGRRIEKLLQEKYIYLCGQIEDEKLDSSNAVADEESSVDEEPVRSLRASPLNTCTKDRTSIEDFEIIKPISRGAYGRVFLARKRATGDLFAIKVLKKADMIRKNAVESILAERNILISVRNPFVVRFFYSFTCRENLYLVMEFLNGGDLFSMLKNLGCLDEEMGRVYIAEVVLALEYLHSLNIIHRDLKPDNLLIGQDGHIKLTDFGLSKVGLINNTDDLSGPSQNSSGFFANEAKNWHSANSEDRQKHSVVGTPDYLAPEILLGMGHSATADWWSVGVILFEMLVGVPPFNAETPHQIFDSIINRDIPWPRIPQEMSYEAYDLIDKLLAENSVQRLGATGSGEVKQHPFFKDINWDTLARQKAMFIPTAEPHDTSYFMSRYIWNPEEEHVWGGSDFDDLTDGGSSSSFNTMDEDGDECGSLADFGGSVLVENYSFSNFSFKNLSQLASINYDFVLKNTQESTEAQHQSVS